MSTSSRLRTFKFLEFDLVDQFAGVGRFRAESRKARAKTFYNGREIQFERFLAKKGEQKTIRMIS